MSPVRRFLLLSLAAVTLVAQNEPEAAAPATPAATIKDPLNRSTPQSSVLQFLEACHSHDYAKAKYYLDLRGMSPADRAVIGPAAARQLEDLLDDTAFDIANLSRDPEGDPEDNDSETLEQLARFEVDGHSIDLQLERVEMRPGLRVWLVSAASVRLIATAHKVVEESAFEKKLPQFLVTSELFDTPIWRWIALLLIAATLWMLAGVITWAVTAPLKVPEFRSPLRLGFTIAGLHFALGYAPPAAVSRLFLDRGIEFLFAVSLAWMAAELVDFFADRWHRSLDPRIHSIGFSVLPLGRQVLKLSLYLVAILTVLSAWGYNTSTILAGLGVGGLAVALAAQKTIENLFGGVSVIGDRPVLVGDVCRFGDRIGTVMHIGLRSTRIRTPERTIVSVPNAQFASMTLENISGRDKLWFHPMLNLRRDTTAAQLTALLEAVRSILTEHPKLETGPLPVRFVGIGPYSLDVEVTAYVKTKDFEEFLVIQQDLLVKILHAVEEAGTALAVPLQENFELRAKQSAGG